MNNPLSGVVLCSVKGHMFQKMGQSVLTILFQDGTHILCNIKIGPISRKRVFSNIVSKTVFQLPIPHHAVERNSLCRGSRFLAIYRQHTKRDQQQRGYYQIFHHSGIRELWERNYKIPFRIDLEN